MASVPDTQHGMKQGGCQPVAPACPCLPGSRALHILGRGLKRQPPGVLGALFCAYLPVAMRCLCCGQAFPTVMPRTSGLGRSPQRGCPTHCKRVSSIPGPDPLNVSTKPAAATQQQPEGPPDVTSSPLGRTSPVLFLSCSHPCPLLPGPRHTQLWTHTGRDQVLVCPGDKRGLWCWRPGSPPRRELLARANCHHVPLILCLQRPIRSLGGL